MAQIESIVQALRQEKERIENAIAALVGISGALTTGRHTAGHRVGNRRRKGKRTLSAAARRKISQAAKARWAKAKKAGRNSL